MGVGNCCKLIDTGADYFSMYWRSFHLDAVPSRIEGQLARQEWLRTAVTQLGLRMGVQDVGQNNLLVLIQRIRSLLGRKRWLNT